MKKKVLVLVSNPQGSENLNVLPEVSIIEAVLGASEHRDRFEIDWKIARTQSDLRRHILRARPQIIHFCGHGEPEGLLLEDANGTAKVVDNEVLIDLLRIFADKIECVLLNVCHSGSLASDLAKHLNYAIGMNRQVFDDAAIAFSEGFYQTLGSGESYERAFEVGKNAVLGKTDARKSPGRGSTLVSTSPGIVASQTREHLIPIIEINPNPRPIKPLWLAPEIEIKAVRALLEAIEGESNTIRLFHHDEPIVLAKQYIPVQVTLERHYQHSVETIGGYAESKAELKQLYAMKSSGNEDIEEKIKKEQVDWADARKEESRIMVLADPGMGKSTLLRREVGVTIEQAYQALEAESPLENITLPLWIRLSTLADEMAGLSVEEAIIKAVRDRHPQLLKHHQDPNVIEFLNAFVKAQLLSGRALLLLDALDDSASRETEEAIG